MDVFNRIAFTVFDQGVSWGELIGDVTGVICVWWLVRQVIWNWPMGLVNNVFFFVLFASTHLYANAVLQIVFFVLGVYGWWQWAIGRAHPDRPERVELPVRPTTGTEWLLMGVAAAIVWPATWAFLVHYTDPAEPMWDSLTLALSLIATYAQAKKMIESSWIYIVVDAISVPLFYSQDLTLTALLFAFFGVLCVLGLRDWNRSYAAGRQLAVEAVA
jgi:nicotinamide mononucleotide transporter